MANVIQLIIQAKNEASAVINTVNKDLSKLAKQQAKGNNPNPFLGFNGTVAAVAALGVAVAATANSAAKSAAEYERLEHATNSLGQQYGLTSSDILGAVDGIAKGTLSNTTILEQANKAMLLGVADSKEEFETLTKIAIDRGRAMGISMESAFSSIVLGVGRLSPLILDNLGIILDADKTYGEFAKSIGKTADALSDAEKRQALLGRLKAEMGNFDTNSVLDAASAWERLSSEFSNLVIGVGQFLNESQTVTGVLNDWADKLDRINAIVFPQSTNEKVKGFQYQLEANKKVLAEYEAELARLNNLEGIDGFLQNFNGNTSAGLEEAIARIREQIKQLNYEMYLAGSNEGKDNGLGKTYVDAELAAAELAKAAMETAAAEERASDAVNEHAKLTGLTKVEAQGLFDALVKTNGSIDGAIAAMVNFNNELRQAQSYANAVASAMGGAYSALQSVAIEAYKNSGYSAEVVGAYQEQLGIYKNIEQSLKNQGVSEELIGFAVAKATAGSTEYFESINEAANATERASSGTKQLTAEFTSLKGIVSGIFSNLFEDIGGVKVEDFLPREDAPNEAARRIADVMVKGFESPWADYFKTSFPDLFNQYMGSAGGDVKIAAAQLLRDFQNGLRPELIDTNAVKEIAKRMFQVDQSTQAMIDEVSRELAAELGISIEKATGYVSGAAGVKPEVDAEKLKGGLAFKPTYDFSSAQTDFTEAGKAAGFFSESGAILIDTTITISSLEIDEESLPKVSITINSFKLNKDATQVATDIAASVGAVNISTNLNLPQSDSEIWKAINAAIKSNVGVVTFNTFLAVPSVTDLEDFKAQIFGLVGSVGVPVSVAISSSFDSDMISFKNFFIQGLASSDFATTIATTLSLNLTTAFSEQQTQLSLVGLNIGTYIYQGFAAYPIGQTLVYEIGRQIGEAQSTLEASGKNAGKKWGDAFLGIVGENVPIELITILTDLITPEVQKKLQEQDGRK